MDLNHETMGFNHPIVGFNLLKPSKKSDFSQFDIEIQPTKNELIKKAGSETT